MVSPHARALVCWVGLGAGVAGCKSASERLEGLVPDGATGIASADVAAIRSGELYAKLRGIADAQPDVAGKLDALRDTCKLDLDTLDRYVVGFDALGANVVIAMHMPRIGTTAALTCALEQLGGDELATLREEDGRAVLEPKGGEGRAWALDDDTLVLVTKGWVEAVQGRVAGKGKGAIEGNLAAAVALAERKRQVWFAGEWPALAAKVLKRGPVVGLERVGGGFDLGSQMQLVATLEFRDDASASAAKTALDAQKTEFVARMKSEQIPSEMLESVALELDRRHVVVRSDVPIVQLVEQSLASFRGYMVRSKTVEARLNLGSMWRSLQYAATEERVGADGALAPAGCPTGGRAEGSAGITPPLELDCSKGCVAGRDYDAALWRENPVWSALAFEPFETHRYHYDLEWKNASPGRCEFTLKAFGDLDGDRVYSTFARSGTVAGGLVDGAQEPTATDEAE